MAKKSKKKTKKTKLSDEEIAKRKYRNEITGIFKRSGFLSVPKVHDKEIEFKGRKGDFDDIFLYENIVVLVEYTLIKDISTHLLKKKIIFDHVLKNRSEFIVYLETKFLTFKESRNSDYTSDECEVIIVYCSRNQVEEEHSNQVPDIVYFDYTSVEYFHRLSNAIKLSARFELFDFLGLKSNQIGQQSFNKSSTPLEIEGTVLPEKNSNYAKGYKVVSFYIAPQHLLEKAYVLRKDGWRDESEVYQRMIRSAKINQIRRYLLNKKRVFVNNIIVTLPSDTKLLDSDGNPVNPATLGDSRAVTIKIPDSFNQIGLIDGQHRVFAYYEGGTKDDEIDRLRKKQNLLATGIVYPEGISSFDKIKFESELFLEINSNQTKANAELIQAIGLLLNPFDSISIARAVVNRLDATSPLSGQFRRRSFETGKLPITSIVSYAMKPLVKLQGTDSIFALWDHPDKNSLIDANNHELLREYIQYSVSQINMFLSAVREVIDDERWTTDRRTPNRVLTTTIINGLLICFRHLIEQGKTGNKESYQGKLKTLNNFDFGKFRSSQYAAMSRELVTKYFS